MVVASGVLESVCCGVVTARVAQFLHLLQCACCVVVTALCSADLGAWLPQDKVASLLLSNYLLWPVTNHIMSNFVPKQHRAGATHVVTVCAFLCFQHAQ